jgi:hypothetical protein
MLFICTKYIALIGRMTTYKDLELVAVSFLRVLLQHLPGRTKENWRLNELHVLKDRGNLVAA